MAGPVYSKQLVAIPSVAYDSGLLWFPPEGTQWIIKGISVCWGITVLDIHAWVYTRYSGKICVVWQAGGPSYPGQQQEFGTWVLPYGDAIGVATDGNSACDFSVNGYELTLP